MTVSPDDLRGKLDAGRHATADWLSRLADDLDALPLDDAAEVLVWVQDRVAQLSSP